MPLIRIHPRKSSKLFSKQLLGKYSNQSSPPSISSQSLIACSCYNTTRFLSKDYLKEYQETCQSFSLPVPKQFNFANDVVDVWASQKEFARSTALYCVPDSGKVKKLSFENVVELSKKVARLLYKCDVVEGDRAMIILGKRPEWWIITLGCIRAGVIFSPGTTQLTTNDIKCRIDKLKPHCIIVDSETAEKVDDISDSVNAVKILVGGESRPGWLTYEDLMEQVDSHFKPVITKSTDTMCLFFTSGTTGLPKLAVHTHSSYGLGHHITARYWLDLKPGDLNWTLSDTGWAKAAWGLFAPWLAGAGVFVHQTDKFDADATLQLLQDIPVSVFCAPPTAYRSLVLQPLPSEFPALRHCVSAGEPLNANVSKEWQSGTGLEVREGYGQTETVLICGSFRFIPNKPGSMGLPSPGHNVKILTASGQEAEVGEVGNIGLSMKNVRPVGLFAKYKGDPVKTADHYRFDHYLTGDLGYRDEDGYLWFMGRDDDIILSAGYRIGPFEVESALMEHPAVAEAAVVSSPDAERYEIVTAYVVLVPDVQASDQLVEELQNHVKVITAPYKYPRKVIFTDTLPKTVSGKIRRVELRKMQRQAQ